MDVCSVGRDECLTWGVIHAAPLVVYVGRTCLTESPLAPLPYV